MTNAERLRLCLEEDEHLLSVLLGKGLVSEVIAELTAKDAQIDALLAACKAVVEECDATFVDTSEMSPEWCEVEKMCRAAIALAEQEQTDAQ